MESPNLKNLILTTLDDHKAIDILTLDVSKLTSIADSMIICTGTSNRHVQSLAHNILEAAKKQKVRALGTEGYQEGEWILIDFGDIILHIMQPKTRDYYQLEKLWHIPSHASSLQE